MHESSWHDRDGYTLHEETCFYRAAENYPRVKKLAYPLYLSNHWTNDLQDWVMSTLLGKDEYHEEEA